MYIIKLENSHLNNNLYRRKIKMKYQSEEKYYNIRENNNELIYLFLFNRHNMNQIPRLKPLAIVE